MELRALHELPEDMRAIQAAVNKKEEPVNEEGGMDASGLYNFVQSSSALSLIHLRV